MPQNPSLNTLPLVGDMGVLCTDTYMHDAVHIPPSNSRKYFMQNVGEKRILNVAFRVSYVSVI